MGGVVDAVAGAAGAAGSDFGVGVGYDYGGDRYNITGTCGE